MRSLLLSLIVIGFTGVSVAQDTTTLNTSPDQQGDTSSTVTTPQNGTTGSDDATTTEPGATTTEPSSTTEPAVTTTPTTQPSISSEPYSTIKSKPVTVPDVTTELTKAPDTTQSSEPSSVTESTMALDPGVIPGDDVSNLCAKFLSSNRWYISDDKCIIAGRDVIKGSAINPYHKKIRLSNGRTVKATTFRCTENGIEIFIQWGQNNDASYALGFIAPEYGGDNTLVLNLVSAGRLQKECVGSYAYKTK